MNIPDNLTFEQVQAALSPYGYHFFADSRAPFAMAGEAGSGVVGDAAAGYSYKPGTPNTPANDGPMVQFLNVFAPDTIKVLTAPSTIASIIGERQFGSWENVFVTIETEENAAQLAAYGDSSRGGTANANMTYDQRQNYLVQGFIEIGDLEAARWGAGRFDKLSSMRNGLYTAFTKFADRVYTYGINGIPNYGILNDPNLNPANAVTKGKNSGATTWTDKAAAAENGGNLDIYYDVQMAIQRICTAAQGLLDEDIGAGDEFVMIIPPGLKTLMASPNQYGKTAIELLKINFPKLDIRTSPRMATSSGNIMYLYCPRLQGQETIWAMYSEKLRTHRIEYASSMMSQKNSSGVYGAYVARPFLIDHTIGI